MQPQKEQSFAGNSNQGDQVGEDSIDKQQNTKNISERVEDGVDVAQQEVQQARRPWYRVLRQARVLLPLYFVLLALFSLLAFWVHIHPVLAIDVTITRDFQEDRSPWLKTLMVAVSYLGNAIPVFGGIILLTAVIFWVLRLRLEALIIVVVSVTSDLLNVIMKLVVNRPRPSVPLVSVLQLASGPRFPSGRLSFPSGHVMAYMAFWGLLFSLSILIFRANRWWRTVLLIISGLFVVLVGPSRIYLGDHWASDVLGGYIIGGLWVWLWLWLYVQLKTRGVLATGQPGEAR